MENVQKSNDLYSVQYNLTGLNNTDEDQWEQ